MIALTQEKREELTAFINASIEKRCTVYTLAKQRELEVLRDQVALASLTAEPVEYLTWHQGCTAPDDCVEYSVVADKEDKSCDGSDAFPVFIVPPVPEIKLASIDDIPCPTYNNTDYASGYLDGCKAVVEANKRLNGLEE